MALTTEQLLLLNNLMYTHEENFPVDKLSEINSSVKTVEDYINILEHNRSKLESSGDCGCYISGEDYTKIIDAIKSDRELMDMKIASTHIDNGENGGGGFSAVFINEKTGDAVVTFKGTEPDEWPDNFTGATYTDMPDTVSTQHQANALEWYQDVYDELGLDKYEITVTGHSKGGNKAKYITVLDDSVDNCVSFDGQGFSDEFLERYRDEIAANQGKIENHNADNDYVNFLLNDIGKRYFYKSNNIDSCDGGIFEYHSPNSFMTIGEDGSVTMERSSQGPVIQALDSYLTGLVRTMDDDTRKQAAEVIGAIVTGALDKNKDKRFIIDMILDPENSDVVVHILAYTMEYADDLPLALLDQFTDIPGIREVMKIADTINNIQNGVFIKILEGADYLNDKLIKFIEKTFGIDIKDGNFDSVLAFIKKIHEARKKIKLGDNSDRKIYSGVSGKADFSVDTNILRACAENFQNISRILDRVSDEIESCKMSYTMGFLFNSRIKQHASKAQKHSRIFMNMSKALDSAAKTYNSYEKKIMSKI